MLDTERESPHAVVVKCWFTEFERVRGVKPAFRGDRDGKHVKRLLEAFRGDPEKVCALIRTACADPDWMRRRATLSDLDSNPNQFLGNAPAPQGRFPQPKVQPPKPGRQWDPKELS